MNLMNGMMGITELLYRYLTPTKLNLLLPMPVLAVWSFDTDSKRAIAIQAFQRQEINRHESRI